MLNSRSSDVINVYINCYLAIISFSQEKNYRGFLSDIFLIFVCVKMILIQLEYSCLCLTFIDIPPEVSSRNKEAQENSQRINSTLSDCYLNLLIKAKFIKVKVQILCNSKNNFQQFRILSQQKVYCLQKILNVEAFGWKTTDILHC